VQSACIQCLVCEEIPVILYLDISSISSSAFRRSLIWSRLTHQVIKSLSVYLDCNSRTASPPGSVNWLDIEPFPTTPSYLGSRLAHLDTLDKSHLSSNNQLSCQYLFGSENPECKSHLCVTEWILNNFLLARRGPMLCTAKTSPWVLQQVEKTLIF